MTTNTDTQAHGGGVEAVREAARTIYYAFGSYWELPAPVQTVIRQGGFFSALRLLFDPGADLCQPPASPAAPAPAAGVIECPATELGIITPAATSAETQGGDGVREALEAADQLERLAFSKQMSQRPLDYEQVQIIFKSVAVIRAALAPSTSAATRGEPVELYRWRVPGESWSSWFVAPLPDPEGIEIETRTLYDHPAPAVESAQVKEGRWWDKPEPPLPRDAEAAYPIVRDAVLASGDPSPRFVQQRFAIGFNRASGFIERMEAEGLITAWQADIQGRRIRASLDLATDAEG